jgi:hypothetical protein
LQDAHYCPDFKVALADGLFSGVEMPMLISANFDPLRNFSSIPHLSCNHRIAEGGKPS